uniref:Uncharacterized protein n=1 Tax=Panagrolaimus davidi TaxID=227884 RepID=A0A914QHV1_9BILA
MHTFVFIVAILLFSSAFSDDSNRLCNESKPAFPDSKGEEIHAMLARDRYINFTSWIPLKREYEGVGPEKIPYGYLKKCFCILNQLQKKVCNRTENGAGLIHENDVPPAYCPLREQFIKFKMFKDGVKVENIYISKKGEPYPWKHDAEYDSHGCHDYEKKVYSNIDGLLIEINCKTTEVKKILVKCEPYSYQKNFFILNQVIFVYIFLDMFIKSLYLRYLST